MDGNGEKARRFNLGRMGLGYLVVIGTMVIAGCLLWHVGEQKIDPATVWVSIVGLAGVIVGYYFGSQTGDGGGEEE